MRRAKKPAQPRKGALPAGSAAAAAAAAGAAAAREQPLSSFYTLTFTLTFPYAADTCYVSQVSRHQDPRQAKPEPQPNPRLPPAPQPGPHGDVC